MRQNTVCSCTSSWNRLKRCILTPGAQLKHATFWGNVHLIPNDLQLNFVNLLLQISKMLKVILNKFGPEVLPIGCIKWYSLNANPLSSIHDKVTSLGSSNPQLSLNLGIIRMVPLKFTLRITDFFHEKGEVRAGLQGCRMEFWVRAFYLG